MSNIVQAQCVRTSTSTHVHYVGRQGCPCRTLYVHKYSVRAQARRPTHNRCIAQAFHAKHCTKHSAYVQAQALMYTTYAAQTVRASTRTACTPKHAGLCTIGASPRLSMSNHCTTGTSTVRTYKHKNSCILRTPPRLFMPYTLHARIHVLTTSGTTLGLHMSTAVHTHIYVQDTLLGLSKPNIVQHAHTPYRMYTRENVAHKLQYKF